jgi:hypothetical protein
LSLITTLFLILIGLWFEADCATKDVGHNSFEAMRLWAITCDDLDDMLDKNLYLKDYYNPHFRGSMAVYECAAGHGLPSGVIFLVIAIQSKFFN